VKNASMSSPGTVFIAQIFQLQHFQKKYANRDLSKSPVINILESTKNTLFELWYEFYNAGDLKFEYDIVMENEVMSGFNEKYQW
jgi:hypothetical protein